MESDIAEIIEDISDISEIPDIITETQLEQIEDIADLSEISEIEPDTTDDTVDLFSDEEIQKIDEQIDVLKADLTANSVQEFSGALYTESVKIWEPDFELLTKKIENLSTGIELPSEIFSLAVISFGISSGVFMTFESASGYFTPFSSLDFDETSLRRCRIHIDDLKKNKLIYSGSNINTSVSKDFLKKYLSKRQWDIIENVDLLIFSHHDTIFGMLLMFNLDIDSHPQFFDFASFFTRKCSELFYNSRSRIIRNLPDYSESVPVEASSVFENLMDAIKRNHSATPSDFKLFFIDYSGIIDYIKKNDSLLDAFKIESDIFRMYSSMLSGEGSILRIFGGKIILSISATINNDKSLLSHQMSASLLSLFENDHLIKPPSVFVETFNPEDSELGERITDFLSDKI